MCGSMFILRAGHRIHNTIQCSRPYHCRYLRVTRASGTHSKGLLRRDRREKRTSRKRRAQAVKIILRTRLSHCVPIVIILSANSVRYYYTPKGCASNARRCRRHRCSAFVPLRFRVYYISNINVVFTVCARQGRSATTTTIIIIIVVVVCLRGTSAPGTADQPFSR